MLRSLNKKTYTLLFVKTDKSTQTDPCLSLEIGDKILAESHSPRTSALDTHWWQAIFKWY